MRSEKEMFDLILEVAKADPRVRAVLLNGSRADKTISKDCFQDYDIVYVVSEVRPFADSTEWIDVFGERMILQLPVDWHTHPYDYNSNKPFVYLMQFKDGTRIDLTICTFEDLKLDAEPTVVLYDKEGILPHLPETGSECYHVKAPSGKQFSDVCNEFWWLCPYVSKELWREGLPLAKAILEQDIRHQLTEILNWSIGIEHNFKVNLGKRSKYLKQFLSAEDWYQYEQTFPVLTEESIWNSLFAMCALFRKKALQVAGFFDYSYPIEEESAVLEYLKHIRGLPKNSQTIY